MKPRRFNYTTAEQYEEAVVAYRKQLCTPYETMPLEKIPPRLFKDLLFKYNVVQTGSTALQLWRLDQFRRGNSVRMTPSYRPWARIWEGKEKQRRYYLFRFLTPLIFLLFFFVFFQINEESLIVAHTMATSYSRLTDTCGSTSYSIN